MVQPLEHHGTLDHGTAPGNQATMVYHGTLYTLYHGRPPGKELTIVLP